MPKHQLASRSVNVEFLAGLELVSNKVFPLPGGVGRRQNPTAYDPRLTHLSGLTPVGEEVIYYEHIATVRHKATNQFFVAFKETMDAFLARSTDLQKYPEWLMKQPNKQAEREIHIYLVTRTPQSVPIMRSHEDWLAHIADIGTFDTLAYFLARNDVIDEKALATLR